MGCWSVVGGVSRKDSHAVNIPHLDTTCCHFLFRHFENVRVSLLIYTGTEETE
ncbi:hypothetical protein HSB1_40180 [Halogranum salarium B-1]|uniref:Uncharacterized protein n=1 Tax=Halogranum salarium B-1 TaxID=1210908 RepID=J3ETV4_9EURY|nr:hypothetical protein HSB1_40180 [Halogranum salarium B-1]